MFNIKSLPFCLVLATSLTATPLVFSNDLTKTGQLDYFACPCPQIIAHRGASGSFPDSTNLAFRKALEFGSDILELDVHLSKDNKIIVTHDDSLLRTTGKDLLINKTKWKKIKKADAGYTFKNELDQFPYRNQGLKILTLNQLLQKFPEARFNIEIKSSDIDLSNEVYKFVKKNNLQHRVVVASKYAAILNSYREKKSPSYTSAHVNDAVWAYIHWLFNMDLRDEPYQVLQLPYEYVNKSLVEYFHSQGKKVHVWTVNNPEDIRRMIQMGVDGVMTDYPEKAYEVFVELGLRQKSNKQKTEKSENP